AWRDRGADWTLMFGGTEAWAPSFEDASIAAKIAAPTAPANSRLKNGFQILFIVAFPFLFRFQFAPPPRLRTCFRRRSFAPVSRHVKNNFPLSRSFSLNTGSAAQSRPKWRTNVPARRARLPAAANPPVR